MPEQSLRSYIALAVLPEMLRQFGPLHPFTSAKDMQKAVKIAFETADEFLRQEEEYRKAQPPVISVRPPSKAPDNPRPNFYEDK
jgi:GH25 family lysozyme M1 (1,4-beta-N-acetylmuramidase)